MVGISFKKKSLNIVHLETYSTYKDYLVNHKLKLPLVSFITYCIHKYCTSPLVAVRFIPVKTTPENEMAAVTITEENVIFLINEYEIPWPVALCVYPVIMCEDVIITGLCAVVRQICIFINCPRIKEEHEDGLLGFRFSCLQAPNEISIWTKFCEIDLIETAQELLTATDIKEVPRNLVRFEDHMKKPARVHNISKIAQQLKNDLIKAQKIANLVLAKKNVDQSASSKQQSKAQEQTKVELKPDTEQAKQQSHDEPKSSAQQQVDVDKQATTEKLEQNEVAGIQDPKDSGEGTSSATRTVKLRKWKSHKIEYLTDSSTTQDFQVSHKYSEGPYLTLADLVLFPLYHIIIRSIGEARFESLLPFTYRWYIKMVSIPKIHETYGSYMNQIDIKELPSDNATLAIAENVSLYKCDPKRHNSKRMFTKEEDIEKALSLISEGMELPVSDNTFETSFKWEEIPEHANPFAGYLPDGRVQRKSEQLENLAMAVLSLATDGDVIVDFCCGSGHLGILLAYLLPRCTIILLENKVQSLKIAKDRVKKLRINNVFYYQCNVDFFIGEFDIGIGLHACGIATDLILDKCLKVNATFLVSPCCYGSLHETTRMEYPRSKKYSHVPINDYLCIGHAADQTHKEHPLTVRGARCMTIIDSDRGRLAEEKGYKVTLMRLKPITCTPKNNLLIGISPKT